jgi:hypothetical protein
MISRKVQEAMRQNVETKDKHKKDGDVQLYFWVDLAWAALMFVEFYRMSRGRADKSDSRFCCLTAMACSILHRMVE